MDSLIKEINENLKTIIDTMKETLDNSVTTLDNIQIQMDKKVEEAKKYKIQVDSAKERIKELESDNKSLELSLVELNEKYGKLNLVSIVEAGNREIKLKINDNLKEINKQKEHIAELTNKARTIKDLLMNLKKDKTVKEERLEKVRVVYAYYSDRLNDVIDYAFDHAENLMDYKNSISYMNVNYDNEVEENEETKNIELENTMVFDEIASIDNNKNFKDEMTFISDQINEEVNNSSNVNDIIKRSLEEFDNKNEIVDGGVPKEEIEEPIDTTQVFDTIINDNFETKDETQIEATSDNLKEETNVLNPYEVNEDIIPNEEDFKLNEENVSTEEETEVVLDTPENEDTVLLDTDLKTDISNINDNDVVSVDEDKFLDEENEMRINKINDLFSNFENTNVVPTGEIKPIQGVEEKIDNAYMDIFGQPLNSEDLNKKEPTLTDIFGNPISKSELSEEVKVGKKLEELFVENGIDFNKFREDEKNYLKEIYDEEKFNNILDTLKRNKINLDNIYNAFNIFGEISANELENLISKLINVGQSVEAIGVVLEKLPKVKKYNLDEAIMSYGDYVKDIDITELIMNAKELYKNGGNN